LNIASRVLYGEAEGSREITQGHRAVAAVMYNRLGKYDNTSYLGDLAILVQDAHQFQAVGKDKFANSDPSVVDKLGDAECASLQTAIDAIRETFLQTGPQFQYTDFLREGRPGIPRSARTIGGNSFWVSETWYRYKGGNGEEIARLRTKEELDAFTLKPYKFVKGDNPSKLSQKLYGYQGDEWRNWNPPKITNPKDIQIGQTLLFYQK
jgi:hypothetical protein